MSGIAGFSGSFDRDVLERMGAAIAHRGPDGAGSWFDASSQVGLVHRHLARTREPLRSPQPLRDDTGQRVVVLDGWLWDREHGESDAASVLRRYRRDGAGMLDTLRGNFALALSDRVERVLLLARDGVGIKPLYYAAVPRGLLFASELKAVLQAPDVPRDLDASAVRHYLAYLWAPAPETMLCAVRKLPPGHAMTVRDGRVERTWRYYDLPYDQPVARISLCDAAAQVRDTARRAVERHLPEDANSGAFLSGGLDSSSVVALARTVRPESRMRCYCIGFRDRAFEREGFASDRTYARRVAGHVDVDLEVVEAGPEIADRLEAMVWYLDEPQADPAPLLALEIGERAHAAGIRVLLSGTGGEDFFAGLRRHQALGFERWWSWLPRPVRAVAGAAAGALPSCVPVARRARKALQYVGLDGDERLASYFYWTRPAVLEGLAGPWLRDHATSESLARPLLDSLANLPPGTVPLHRMLYLEGKHFLADHNLNYNDKMGMAAGVEVRMPLLDPDLVALAARLPARFKQRGADGKRVFKRAMEPLLPREILRRPKTGFGAPIRRWLQHEWRPLVEDVLSARSLEQRGLFDPAAVRDLVARDRAGREDGSYTLFSMLCIELWCRRFLQGTPTAP